MDLTLSHTADYVVRAAISLARSEPGSYRRIGDVAEEMRIPRGFAPQVLGALAHAGLAESRAGRAGGYRLARPASRITMLEVVEAAEGGLISTRCPMRGGPCRPESPCELHGTWSRVSDSVRRALARTRLAEVASAPASRAG